MKTAEMFICAIKRRSKRVVTLRMYLLKVQLLQSISHLKYSTRIYLQILVAK